MATNDVLPFSATEAAVAPGAAADVSSGVTIAAQATRMALTVIVEEVDTIDGTYSIIVETADAFEGPAGEWLENSSDRIDGVGAAGTRTIYLSEPVLDKVRARIETDAVTPENVEFTFIWQADTALTLI